MEVGVELVINVGTVIEFFYIPLCIINHFLDTAFTTGPCGNLLCRQQPLSCPQLLLSCDVQLTSITSF